MGLDMYLSQRKTLACYDHDPKEQKLSLAIIALLGLKPEQLGGLPGCVTIQLPAAYWRKENHIHQWFVEHVQDGKDECQDSYVSREQLHDLVVTCQSVLIDHDKAEELLPTQSGFFFGSTDYDESYFDGCRRTVEIINKALELPEDGEFIYHSSW